MKQTVQEAAREMCEAWGMENNHGYGVKETFEVGDIVPYRNTRGNIKKAKIISFETVPNGKVWFNGIDIETKAKVWYPLHISKKLIQ